MTRERRTQVEDEVAIRALIDELARSIRARDADGVMSVFAPEVVSFDLGPPLRHGGGEEFVRRWKELFLSSRGALDYEVSDPTIVVGDDVAFSHSLNRIASQTGNGKSERWVRWTACYRKTKGKWLIVHEHVSVPVDVREGKALLTLTPPGTEAETDG